jgi:hypothetical protein
LVLVLELDVKGCVKGFLRDRGIGVSVGDVGVGIGGVDVGDGTEKGSARGRGNRRVIEDVI